MIRNSRIWVNTSCSSDLIPKQEMASSGARVKKKRTKVTRACNNCRRRKIKCSGANPCLNCQTYQCECSYIVPSLSSSSSVEPAVVDQANESLVSANHFEDHSSVDVSTGDSLLTNGLYENDSELLQQIAQLQSSIRALQAFQSYDKVGEALKCLREQMEELVTRWQPKVRLDAIKSTSTVPPNASRSLETQLMMSKYSNDVYLTKFSRIQLSENIAHSSVLNEHPVVDDTFGLYSPALSLSVRGIGFLFKKFFTPNTKMARDYKETLYLMLRFFDTCFYHLDLSVKTWSMPIETYYSLNLKPLEVKADCIRDLLSKIPNELIDKTKLAYPLFPKPQDIDDKVQMFHWIIRVSLVFCEEFKSVLILRGKSSETSSTLANYLSVGEILSVLAFDYLNVTAYTPCGDLDYLESLLYLVKQQYWIGEFHVFSHLISMAVCYAQNLGIHRWEFYVGMNEELAERRRQLWWKCYSWDRFFAVQTGKQPMIEESHVNCLLPEFVRKAGFLDHNDLVDNILTLKQPLAGSTAELLDYSFYALAQLIGDFFTNVLYSSKYTDFRNHGKPDVCKEFLMEDLRSDVNLFAAKVDIIKIQAKDLFFLSSKVDNVNNLAPEDVEEVTQAAVFEMYFEYCLSVCLNSVEHLFARFKVDTFPKTIEAAIGSYKKRIHKSWDVVMHIMQQRHIFLMWQSICPACVVLLTVVSDYFAHFGETATDDLISVLRVSRNLDLLEIFGDDGLSKVNWLRRQYMKGLIFFQILVRVNLQLYKRTTSITKEELLRIIGEKDKDLAIFAGRLLDIESKIFKHCLTTKEKSSIHIEIRRALEQEEVLDYHNKIDMEFPGSTNHPMPLNTALPGITIQEPHSEIKNNANHPLENDATMPMSPLLNFNLGSLDDFLNAGEDDLYNKLWSDIQTTSIPNFLNDEDQ